MADYIELPVETDIETLQDLGISYLEAQVDGWEANPGNLETWMIEAVARIAAETAFVTAQVPPEIFRYFGEEILGLPTQSGLAASVGTTWTAIDTDGHVIQEGTFIDIDGFGFVVDHDVTIPSGSASTAVGAVLVFATDEGEEYNGLSEPIEPVEALDWVSVITAVGETSGGRTEEDIDSYLARLATVLQLQSPRPILPNDFAVLADQIPGVERATAIDGYNPAAGGSYNNERMLAIAAVDENGDPVSSAIKTEIQTTLDALREINFVINTVDPTYTDIDVTFTAKAHSGFDKAATELAAEQAVADYLSPANWGQPQYVSDVSWVNVTVVRYLEISQVINNVEGISYIQTLTVEGGTVDVTLTGGPAPLTRPGVINGTVT
jgi:Baseplate J-like protein